jgi:hypothetical protein
MTRLRSIVGLKKSPIPNQSSAGGSPDSWGQTPNDAYRRELEKRLNSDPDFVRELKEFQASHPA